MTVQNVSQHFGVVIVHERSFKKHKIAFLNIRKSNVTNHEYRKSEIGKSENQKFEGQKSENQKSENQKARKSENQKSDNQNYRIWENQKKSKFEIQNSNTEVEYLPQGGWQFSTSVEVRLRVVS